MPPGYLEREQLRPMREQILTELRWRYREGATLAGLLQRPPADPETALMWRLRLEEHASYLQAMAGREVISLRRMEDP